jgi:hypothetical protein
VGRNLRVVRALSPFYPNFLPNGFFSFSNNILQTDTIHIAIFDYDVVGKHDFMGELYLKAADFCNGQKWYMLSPRPGHRDRVAGEVLVKIQIY